MATGAMIAGAALSAGGSLYGGISARNAARGQATQLRNQARLEREAAEFDALRSERQFEKLLGNQKLATASSGIELEGSPMLLIEETLRDKEETIKNILTTGRARESALMSKAKNTQRAGRDAMIGSIFQAGGAGLKAYGNIKK